MLNAFNFFTKKVLIIVSKSLGDTIAAMPYIDKYRVDTDTDIDLYVNINKKFQFLFKNSYPDLKYVNDSENSNYNLIILNYKFDKNIQEGFANTLGYKEWKYIRPKINISPKERPIKNKYITFGIHSTLQMKYWNHPDGEEVQNDSPYWNELCGLLKKSNITPVCLELHSSFGVPPYYNQVPKKSVNKIGMSLEEVINYIEHSEFYIGLSSGMAWVAHALGKPVMMIANFTEDWNEFGLDEKDYKRITNKEVCHGCFNKIGIEHEWEVKDWYWCPKHKDTQRQFECHTSITPKMVMEKINDWLIK